MEKLYNISNNFHKFQKTIINYNKKRGGYGSKNGNGGTCHHLWNHSSGTFIAKKGTDYFKFFSSDSPWSHHDSSGQ